MFLLSTVIHMHPFSPQDGVTPLFAASQNNHSEIVTLLLNASALVDLARSVSIVSVSDKLLLSLMLHYKRTAAPP